MKIYFDVCTLNRPFDDALHDRIMLEAEAVAQIMELVETGRVTDYSSEMSLIEMERTRDPDRRKKVIALLPDPARIIPLTDELLDAAEEIVALGFQLADAVHLATAIQLEVDYFVTVDDKLIKRIARLSRPISVRAVNPVDLLQELGDAIDR